jgi:hypothetical protein
MASTTKTEKLGKYVKKIGYFDIRQKMPTRHGQIVEGQTWEILLYHGKKKVGGPYASHDAAKIHAEELMSEGFVAKKHTKSS